MGDAADDLFDRYVDFDLDGDEIEPELKTCNRCGATGLHWDDPSGKWLLFNRQLQLHRCESADPTLGFERIV